MSNVSYVPWAHLKHMTGVFTNVSCEEVGFGVNVI